MKAPVLFLDQQSWKGGAQYVLDEVLAALDGKEFFPIVALPEEGPFAADLRSRGIETLFYPLGGYRAGRKSIFEMMAYAVRSVISALAIARVIRRRKVRLVYINGPRCLAPAVLAARLTRTPTLFHLHLTLSRGTEILLARLLAEHVDHVLACSKAAAEVLQRGSSRLASTLEVVYNPVRRAGGPDPRVPAPSAPWPVPGGFVIGMVGRITPHKGQDVLLRAAAKLRSTCPNLRLVFVGDPAPRSTADALYMSTLQSIAHELGLEEKVAWCGYQRDPGPYYSALDVLALPCTAAEGLPMVVLEAIERGVPVIASRTGGIPELVREGQNGLLVTPGDDEDLANALKRFFANSDLRARLRAGARATLDGRFSPETFRKTVGDAITRLCLRKEQSRARSQQQEAEVRL